MKSAVGASGVFDTLLATSTQVVVFHNVATDDVGRLIAMMDGYQPGHPLVPVAEFKAGGAEDWAIHSVLNFTYREFNIGTGPASREYRYRENRSLSVGDVVQIGEHWFACASFGWDVIAEPQWFALGVKRHGTTSLDEQ